MPFYNAGMGFNRRALLTGFFASATATMLAGTAKGFEFFKRDESHRFKGYAQALELAAENKADYVLLYDTHHQNRGMSTYPLEPDALAIAQAANAKHIFLEFPREFQPLMDLRARGAITEEDFIEKFDTINYVTFRAEEKDRLLSSDKVFGKITESSSVVMIEDPEGRDEMLRRMARGLVEAHKRGIKVWGADKISHTENLANRLNHDGEVSDYIAQKAGGERAIITYGYNHGAMEKNKGIDDELAKRHGRVMPIELTEVKEFYRGSVIGDLSVGAMDILRSAEDRPSHSLNSDTGEFHSNPAIKNDIVKGTPRAERKPAPKSKAKPTVSANAAPGR